MRQNAKITQKQHAMESKQHEMLLNNKRPIRSCSWAQTMQRRKYLFSNMSNTAMLLLVAPRASRPTWRQVLSAPVKRNWSNPVRVTCEHRQLPLRGNLPQPHSAVTRPCKKEHAEKHSQIRKNMDPNAARQSPQQRKFDNHRSKIMMLIRDKNAIVNHHDKKSQCCSEIINKL
jgi:hypothetical protein